ncbi:hypothetical protein [Streptomyces tropicalis]|uniref:Secreted protein n=1 Tax=Streptomyces tropicalis TaxID=3034234 RepID=A0ABT6A1Q1_9ACTN|nr:hypothetical protein [Streptomyces tropicalis]MDF3297740.1 hypothetical protein [Streptomyces tropicalis]
MPRPTAAQLAYGSCTVIFSTLAMLLLSQTSSGLGITVIALAALALGLLVAMTVPLPRARASAAAADADRATGPAAVTAPGADGTPEPVRVRRERVSAGAPPARVPGRS